MSADYEGRCVHRRPFRQDDPALHAALEESAKAGLPPIQVAPHQGKLLMLLAQAIGARRILEIGTLGGYSAIWLARALPEGGRLVTLEADPAGGAPTSRRLEESRDQGSGRGHDAERSRRC
jgi:predicted O-methyltransferase YrrM